MAGHRNGRPPRAAARTERMRRRYEAEPDPAARLILAYDWLRYELTHLARSRAPGVRDEADSLLLDAAKDLAERARQASTRSDAQ